MQQVKFFGEANIEINERTLEFLEKNRIKQLYISNAGLKFIEHSVPKAFEAFISSTKLIYFGLETYQFVTEDNLSLM